MNAGQRCLDDDTITALLERRLDASQMRGIDGHLDSCAACRSLVATLADDVSCARFSNTPDVLEETFADPDDIPPAILERVGSVLKEKWTLESVLGVGGMAAVYKARHRIGRLDAIKVVHRELARDAEVCARFEREARAVNRLSHRGAVAIRDIDVTADGAPFMVMEFLDGEPLSAAATAGLAHRRVLEIASEILDVLADAHALGVIHRDVKPANIFLTKDSAVKLLDFGLARLRGMNEQSAYTKAGQTLGTLAYMPPEQLRGEGVDHRADIFSVGATMFRVLAGRHVHVGTSTPDTLVRIASQHAPSLADVAPDVPLDICQVVDRALAFEADDRYPDAETMRVDVLALLDGDAPSYATSWSADKHDPDAECLAFIGKTVGGYRLDRLIARGGMGAVYAASRDQERVAVKVILNDVLQRGGDARARFRREIRAASRIQSPHVVRVLDAGIDDVLGLPFYAMELLEGRDLSQWLEEVSPLDPTAVAHIFVQACRGVRAAEERGIVHRDIKPANIMLTPNAEGELVVKLCDFGLAKTASAEADVEKSQSLTQSGSILGTPRYSAPEQTTRAKEVDVRADIWGLCLSMHEALSGHKPWAKCETLGQLIVAICTEDVPSLRAVAPWVDPGMATLVASGLVRDRESRNDSLASIEAQLAAWVGEPPLTAAMMRRATNAGVDIPMAPSEDTTVAHRPHHAGAPSPATRRGSRGYVAVVVAMTAVAAMSAAGWLAWSNQAAPAAAIDLGSAGPSFTTKSPVAPATSPSPPSAVSPSAVSKANVSKANVPQPTPTATPGPKPSSVPIRVPVPPAVPKGKRPSKPGGLDFHKKW